MILDRWSRDVPGDARPYLLRPEIDTRMKKEPEQIIASYRAALERDPGLDRARLGLADQLRIYHHNAEAAAEYANYLARKPDDLLGSIGAGQNALEMGDEREAIRSLDHALKIAPEDPVALGARASVETRRNRFESALSYLDRAMRADPFDYVNRSQRMWILARLGRKSEADAERKAVERIRSDQEEFARIHRALRDSPGDLILRGEAAHWLMLHGHETEAIEWANLVLRAEPAHPAMNRLLADHYRKKGQPGLAKFYETHAASPSEQPSTNP